MRDINIVKHRKLLDEIQQFCSCAKQKTNFMHRTTDYERGFVAGKHAAYNDVLRELHQRMRHADYYWNGTHCREEKCDT